LPGFDLNLKNTQILLDSLGLLPIDSIDFCIKSRSLSLRARNSGLNDAFGGEADYSSCCDSSLAIDPEGGVSFVDPGFVFDPSSTSAESVTPTPVALSASEGLPTLGSSSPVHPFATSYSLRPQTESLQAISFNYFSLFPVNK
jgi:hypothetical protein